MAPERWSSTPPIPSPGTRSSTPAFSSSAMRWRSRTARSISPATGGSLDLERLQPQHRRHRRQRRVRSGRRNAHRRRQQSQHHLLRRHQRYGRRRKLVKIGTGTLTLTGSQHAMHEHRRQSAAVDRRDRAMSPPPATRPSAPAMPACCSMAVNSSITGSSNVAWDRLFTLGPGGGTLEANSSALRLQFNRHGAVLQHRQLHAHSVRIECRQRTSSSSWLIPPAANSR